MKHVVHWSGRSTQERYTPEDDTIIAAQWARGPLRALVAVLNRSESSLSKHACRLVRAGVLTRREQFYWRRWTVRQNDVLADYWGRLPDADVARRLGRTVGACVDQAGFLGLRRKEQYLTASDLARLLGVDSHRITYLAGKGWLRLARAPYGASGRRWWHCTERDLERFLRQHPAQYDPRRIVDAPWQRLARQTQQAADLLTVDEAAVALGIAHETVVRACRQGRLPAEKATLHGGTGIWRIRRADLASWERRRAGGLRAAPIVVKAPKPVRLPRIYQPKAAVRFRPVEWRTA